MTIPPYQAPDLTCMYREKPIKEPYSGYCLSCPKCGAVAMSANIRDIETVKEIHDRTCTRKGYIHDVWIHTTERGQYHSPR